MGQVIQTNGDYAIKANFGGVITLDTGPRLGQTIVTGDLVVEGTTFTVDAENLNVQDNIITVNAGELSNGISLRYSGIQVDRGFNAGVRNGQPVFVYDENADTFIVADANPGLTSVNFTNSNVKVRRILTDSATDNGDLTLVGFANGVVKVTGTSDYFGTILNRINDPVNYPPGLPTPSTTGDDILANVKYVNWAVINNPTYFLRDADTRVVAADASTVHAVGNRSQVYLQIDNNTRYRFFDDMFSFLGLEITNETITVPSTNDDLNIVLNGTGKLAINAPMKLAVQASTPAISSGNNILYAKAPGTGDSGLFFVNTSKSGELVRQQRALLYSMLF